MYSHDLTVINAGSGTVAFKAKTGEPAWTSQFRGARTIYDGRVYIVSEQQAYAVLDLKTGRTLLSVDLAGHMRKRVKDCGEVNAHIAVSETHVFTGDMRGYVWAWDRETGEPVWHERAPGAECFFAVIPVIAGNRLYISSYSFEGERTSLYCYEQVDA